ncbi:MAG TPA: aminotransferase class III-fold pyridoxal phosphate-dependent enzyme [Gemmatimonadaceae bacterium]
MKRLNIHPVISESAAAGALFEYWAVRGSVQPLPGERDQNLRVYTADAGEFILKAAHPGEDQAVLDLQDAALSHLARHPGAPPVPRPVRSVDGRSVVEATVDGKTLAMRLLTWLPGEPMAVTSPHTPYLLHDLGRSLGSLTDALSSFTHPRAQRDLKWDLAAAGWIADYLDRVGDPSRRALIGRLIERYTANIQPVLNAARRSVVHNDANDFNVLVAIGPDGVPSVSGIVDFGDMLQTPVVCDVAIAIAYSMMAKPDPLTAAVHVVAGYHSAFPLRADEVRLLLPLARTRLAVSVINAALQAEISPGNGYLQVSSAPAWELLERLEQVPDALAECRLREACGMEPSPAGVAVAGWLDARRAGFASLMPGWLGADAIHIHNFSVASDTIGGIDIWRDQARFSVHVERQIEEDGRRTGIGRYDEVRAIYTTDLFSVEGNDGPEWRTVHLGIDVGAPGGTAIHAPVGGIVHSVRDNDAPGDYGPTVVLEHPAQDDRPVFWTLFGHLSRESLTRLSPGAVVKAGDLLGWLGDREVNGGWWPHVHVQVLCDLFGRSGDFPGVARPAEREAMLALSPDPSPLLGLPAAARAPRSVSTNDLRRTRADRIGQSLSVSYRRPLHLVRGVLQHLIDSDGRRYLDAVNNVAHVGHSHPDVVQAGQRQMAVLNTNTRYLHEALVDYAERLSSTLPEPLRVCYFVNSGSEANELAIRMARAYTAERDLIVLQSGYHGNTTTLVDASSYKFDGPGGAGAPHWVITVPIPDTYRGPFRRDDLRAGLKYGQAVREAVGSLRQAGRRPAAFLCESILSCAGQVMLPHGYLAEAYRHVRASGGLCIADEVQVGLGRVGSHWWAFQAQGVVPDIVTMGKPLGNGHPLGAVVTTPDVAARFANGMEYFNTFGGNPVSCVIGRTVLDVIERENLRERARLTGGYLMQRLTELATQHVLVGDVRGAGLFIGVELVTGRDERTPAGWQAAYLANRMRELGVLMSTDGPHHNVLKIKPPLCFDERDADVLVDTMERVLRETTLK